ncbi:helix-turn-helix transcriptional regulator [Paenibacillus sp. y28]|uniref:helix-turn-helix transcriptional regulator n=1 Tax=Paenibacillus sp. y28 TaxID=3129110 RepID=UPI00301909C5
MDQFERQRLREQRRHGDAMFPLHVYRMEQAPGETVVDCHWHEEAEFLIVTRGGALFQIDTSYVEVTAGEAVFVHGGEVHAGHALGTEGCDFWAIVFDWNLIGGGMLDAVQRRFIAPLAEHRLTLPRHWKGEGDWERAVLDCLHQIVGAFQGRREGFELLVKAQLLLILHEVAAAEKWSARRPVSPQDAAKVERLKAVLTRVQTDYRGRIRTRDLADAAHMSEGQFCRFFKSMTRKTPVEYMNAYRVNQAALLLRQNDWKVSDVALEVGFDNFSYFIKVFRSQYGCTPSEYRRGISREAAGGTAGEL